jgi:tetratricopeptide (TPR) repeat protein
VPSQAAPAAAERPSRIVRQPRPAPAPIAPEQQALLDEAARLREIGRQHIQARDYDKADKPLREAVVLMERLSAEAEGGEAATAAAYETYRCYELLGDYLKRESAFRGYIRVVRRRRGEGAAARAILRDARRLASQGNQEAAARRAHAAFKLRPRGPVAAWAHLIIAAAAEREGLRHLAVQHYQAALGEDPPQDVAVRVRRNIIVHQASSGALSQAVLQAKVLCRASDQGTCSPDDRVINYCLLARLHAKDGDLPAAVRVLQHAAATSAPAQARVARRELRKVFPALDREIELEVLH